METYKTKPMELFLRDRRIEVPFFQRAYVWHRDEWDRFLEAVLHICKNEESYFMGPLIIKSQTFPANEEISRVDLLIDGQQRLTTFCIFMRVLYEHLNISQEFKGDFFNWAEELILHHNHIDIECFESIMKGSAEKIREKYTKQPKRKIYYLNKVLECYDYFSKSEHLKEFSEKSHRAIRSKLEFIAIELSDADEEQQIFDTINSIGVGLTTAELLKNELFDSASKELYEKTWQSQFEKQDRIFWDEAIVRGRPNIALFMQSALLIFSKEKDIKEQGYENIGSLFKNYKLYIEKYKIGKGNESFIDKLMNLATLYRENINIDLLRGRIEEKEPIQRLMIPILGSVNTPVIPYILFILKEVTDKTERDNMFSLLENYIVRRMVCGHSKKNYNKLFPDMIGKTQSYDELRQRLLGLSGDNIFPSDDELKNRFKDAKLSNKDAKTILYLLDLSLRDLELDATHLDSYQSFSLEHIMPHQWTDNWNEGDINPERDFFISTLGNLTILKKRLNISLSNKAWKEKQKKLKEHATGIKTFDTADTPDTPKFLDADKWDESLIEKRTDWLYKQALAVWPYPKD